PPSLCDCCADVWLHAATITVSATHPITETTRRGERDIDRCSERKRGSLPIRYSGPGRHIYAAGIRLATVTETSHRTGKTDRRWRVGDEAANRNSCSI